MEAFHYQLPMNGNHPHVGLNLRAWPVAAYHPGQVIGQCDDHPPEEAIEIVAQLLIVDKHVKRFEVGFSPILHCAAAHGACKVNI